MCSEPSASTVFTRSAFVARKNNYEHPNWFGVGLAFSTSAALWALVSALGWFFELNSQIVMIRR